MAQRQEDRRVTFLAERLLKTLGMAGAVVRGVPPEPDVVATLADGRRIGMELTSMDLLPGDNSHSIAPALKLLCDTTATMYREMGAPPLHVVFTWKAGVGAPAKNQTQRLAKILLGAVQSCGPHAAGRFSHYTPAAQDHPFIRAFLLSIHIRPCDEQIPDSRWDVQYAAGITYAPLASIVSTVERKSSKPAGYRTPYDETWLVVHNGFESIFTERMLTDAAKTHVFETPYNRLFYVPAYDDTLELLVRRDRPDAVG